MGTVRGPYSALEVLLILAVICVLVVILAFTAGAYFSGGH
jgi:hypothetical protein